MIAARGNELGLDLHDIEIVDRADFPKVQEYADAMWKLRQRKGMTRQRAARALERSRNYFGR